MSILAYSEASIYPYSTQIKQNRQFGLSKQSGHSRVQSWLSINRSLDQPRPAVAIVASVKACSGILMNQNSQDIR
jgi:hypothetical protein